MAEPGAQEAYEAAQRDFLLGEAARQARQTEPGSTPDQRAPRRLL